MLNCSSVMAVELSNWLAVGVDGKTNSSLSPRLIIPYISWALCFPALLIFTPVFYCIQFSSLCLGFLIDSWAG